MATPEENHELYFIPPEHDAAVLPPPQDTGRANYVNPPPQQSQSSANDVPTPGQPQPTAPSLLGPLNTFDVFSLIVNKMVGTGIFTAPAQVLLATQSKQLALALWALGFLYTIMSMFLYLDYAVFLPYTGGELVYLDEISSKDVRAQLPQPNGSATTSPTNGQVENGGSRSNVVPLSQSAELYARKYIIFRWTGDGLLAYTAYAFLFIAIFNSGTNSMQTALQILIARNPNADQDRDLIRFIGIVVLSIICLVQLISARAGRTVNRIFAIVKVVVLFVLFCFGANQAKIHGNSADFTKHGTISKIEGTQALLIILYSFEGWENANFVAGEINFRTNRNTLRNGFFWAVGVVGTLYLILNVVFLAAIPYDNVLDSQKKMTQYNYPAAFFGNADSIPARRAWAILIAISSVGNVNTVVYTFSRVKQAIGQSYIFPWSSWWRQDFLFETVKSTERTTEHLRANQTSPVEAPINRSPTVRGGYESPPPTDEQSRLSDSQVIGMSESSQSPITQRGRRSMGVLSGEAESRHGTADVTRSGLLANTMAGTETVARGEDQTFRFTPIGGLTLEWISTVISISYSAAIPATLESVSLPGNIQAYAHCFFLVLLGFGLLRLKSREEELGPPTRDTSKVWRASQWKLGWKLLIVVVYCAFNIFILSVSAKYPSTGADNPYVSVTGHIYPSITFGLLCLALLYYGATFLGLGRNPTVAWYKSVIPWTGVTSTICKAPAYNVLETKVYRFGSRRTITFTFQSDAGKVKRSIYWVLGGGQLSRNPLVTTYRRWKERLEIWFSPLITGFKRLMGTFKSWWRNFLNFVLYRF